jgi:hypothetical protein
MPVGWPAGIDRAGNLSGLGHSNGFHLSIDTSKIVALTYHYTPKYLAL